MKFKKRVKVQRRKAILEAQNKGNLGTVAKNVDNTPKTVNLTENTLKTKKAILEKPQKAALEVKNTPNLTVSEPPVVDAVLVSDTLVEVEKTANTAKKEKTTKKKTTTTKKTTTKAKKTKTKTSY